MGVAVQAGQQVEGGLQWRVDSVIAGWSAWVSIYKVIQRGFCVGRSAYFCLRWPREEDEEEEDDEEEREREREEEESEEYLRFFLLLRCLCFLLLFFTFLEDFLLRLGLEGSSSWGSATPSSSISRSGLSYWSCPADS